MRTTFSAITATLTAWLTTATLSFASELPRPSLDNLDGLIHSYFIGVNGFTQIGFESSEYDYAIDGPFRKFAESRARELKFVPFQGYESRYEPGEFQVMIFGNTANGDSVASFTSQPFKLEKEDGGWKIPNIDLKWEVSEPGTYRFVYPTVTDWEVTIWDNGKTTSFSTKVDLRQFLPSLCAFPSIRNTLLYGHIVAFPRGILTLPWERLELTLWEGDLPTTFNYTRPEPSRPKIRPLTIGIRLVYGLPMISVSGDGAEFAVVQQRRSLTAR